jgi:hypothetical protein
VFSPETGVILALPSLASAILATEGLGPFLLSHMPYGRTALETSSAASVFVNHFLPSKEGGAAAASQRLAEGGAAAAPRAAESLAQGRAESLVQGGAAAAPRAAESLALAKPRAAESLAQGGAESLAQGGAESLAQGIPAAQPRAGGRRLLELSAIIRGDWQFNCTSIQFPVAKIGSAFWDTVRHYEGGHNQTEAAPCNLSAGLSNCLGYTLPPPRENVQEPSLLSQILFYVPTLGLGGERIMDAFLSPMPYENAQDQDLITGQRLMQDMGVCNFTRLTLGPSKPRSFLPMFLFLVILFTLVSYMCMPFSFCSSLLWYLLFPVILFWAMYNVSPLCWPMIPPRFVRDVHTEINNLLPTQIAVPRYLVRPHCTVDGRLSDGTYDPACFTSCADPPFLFKSWQDTLIWWICEASTTACVQAGDYALSMGSFQDLASSADYYASVIDFAYKDPELVQAHRMCAMLSLYNVIFLLMGICIGCYLLPSLLLAVIDIFAGCVILILETYNAEQ